MTARQWNRLQSNHLFRLNFDAISILSILVLDAQLPLAVAFRTLVSLKSQ